MMTLLSAINWVNVLLAFAGYFILGALWFTLFFKKPYRLSLGIENSAPPSSEPIFFMGPALCSLVITITSALLLQALRTTSYLAALEFALLIGVGYLFANTVNIAINPNIPRPILYGVISGTFHLVGIIIVCLVLFAGM